MKIFLGIGALVIIGIFVIALIFTNANSIVPSNQTNPELPTTFVPTSSTNVTSGLGSSGPSVAASTSTSTTVPGNNGSNIVTRDFVHDSTTMADPSNAGNYYLTGSSTDGFAIGYRTPAQFFTISLEKEPLGQTRMAAENFLLKSLGVSQDKLCNLKYYIGTDVETSSLYAGKNLGFSFCPGATPLPQ